MCVCVFVCFSRIDLIELNFQGVIKISFNLIFHIIESGAFDWSELNDLYACLSLWPLFLFPLYHTAYNIFSFRRVIHLIVISVVIRNHHTLLFVVFFLCLPLAHRNTQNNNNNNQKQNSKNKKRNYTNQPEIINEEKNDWVREWASKQNINIE